LHSDNSRKGLQVVVPHLLGSLDHLAHLHALQVMVLL
jgi:hypothetical protein